jgi:chromosome segregation ATPase
MARTGVTYFDISQAATTLSDQGREPTVDTVRALLGTGSKSTIGPLLKQWKAKFAGVVNEEKSGLPRELLATVKGLYEGMQQQAHAQIEAIQLQARTEVEHARKIQLELDQRNRATEEALTQLRTEHTQALSERDAQRGILVEVQQAHAVLQSQVEALEQRLKDKTHETTGLKEQLELAQRNLEHYRESVREQRDQERMEFDRQLRQHEQSLREAREEFKALRVEQDRALREHTQVQTERDHLRAESVSLHARSEKLAATLQERQYLISKLEDRHATLEQSHGVAVKRIEQIELQNLGLEKAAAADLEKMRGLESALKTAKDEIENLRRENSSLGQEKAMIAGQFKQLQRAL